MATLTACGGSCPTAPPLASPRRIVAQSQRKNPKSRRSNALLLDRTSTYVPPTWQNGSRCRFASSQAHLSSWPNPHSTRGTAAAHIPRFRALALFGRRPLERVGNPTIPASENLHKNGSRAHSILVSTGEHRLRWSFGQPGLPQCFFESREIFGTPIRGQVLEHGNT